MFSLIKWSAAISMSSLLGLAVVDLLGVAPAHFTWNHCFVLIGSFVIVYITSLVDSKRRQNQMTGRPGASFGGGAPSWASNIDPSDPHGYNNVMVPTGSGGGGSTS